MIYLCAFQFNRYAIAWIKDSPFERVKTYCEGVVFLVERSDCGLGDFDRFAISDSPNGRF